MRRSSEEMGRQWGRRRRRRVGEKIGAGGWGLCVGAGGGGGKNRRSGGRERNEGIKIRGSTRWKVGVGSLR